MKKIILLVLFFFIPNLAYSKIITLNYCYDPTSDGILSPNSLKDSKTQYKKYKYIIDTERKTITYDTEVNDVGGLYLPIYRKYLKIYRLDFFDGRFAKGINTLNDNNVRSITIDLKDNTLITETNWKGTYWHYKCENNTAADILKKIIGK
jgi:hypothetical protein